MFKLRHFSDHQSAGVFVFPEITTTIIGLVIIIAVFVIQFARRHQTVSPQAA